MTEGVLRTAAIDRFQLQRGTATGSGVVVSGAHIYASVLSPLVHVHSYASVQGSVLLDGVQVQRHAQIRRARTWSITSSAPAPIEVSRVSRSSRAVHVSSR